MRRVVLALAYAAAFMAPHAVAQDQITNVETHYGDSDSADRQVIANLKAQGSDVSKPTDVIFYLYFPVKADAEALKEQVASLGFTVKIEKPAGYNQWALIANKTMVPEEGAIIGLSHRFTELAQMRKGVYDGWEAALVR